MTKNNLLTEQLKYTGENICPTKINLCSYKKSFRSTLKSVSQSFSE